MGHTREYQVLLYYKYVPLEDYEEFARKHLAFCKWLRVKGRIIIASEGINGTVSGTSLQMTAYMNELRKDERFCDIEFKIDRTEGHVFKKLFVRAKPELVTFRLPYEVDPLKTTGKYLEPEEFLKAMEQEDTIIIDARSDYEYDVGHFRNAIRPDVRTFREFPEWVKENLEAFKDKQVLTYCTGGIRCEKFSGFLLKEGFKNVSQLHGGIIRYSQDEATQGKKFDGKCYVFDDRISVPVNFAEEQTIVGRCKHCNTPTERFVNCANLDCHLQHLACEECEVLYRGSCSKECIDAPRNTYGRDPKEVKREAKNSVV